MIHIGKNGPEKCPAKKQCRLKDSNGNPAPHFDTMEQAQQHIDNEGAKNAFSDFGKNKYEDEISIEYRSEIARNTIQYYKDRVEEYEMTETNIPATYEVRSTLSSVKGQLSDGIWENSPRMDKVWQNVDFVYLDNKLVILYKNHKQSAFHEKDSKYVMNYFANKAKQVVQAEYPKEYWKRDNDTELDYFYSHESKKHDIKISDVYKVYDLLKGRK